MATQNLVAAAGTAEQEQLLLSLSSELANNDKPVESRRMAGIQLLEATAKAATLWVSMDTMIKSQIKDLLLTTLGSSLEEEARQASSQVIAKVASVEIPLKQWPDLFQSLLRNMRQQGIPAQVKQSTLETLCYVCQEISDPPLVNNEVNNVMRAVLLGTLPCEPSGVRLAATKALLNVLGFAQANFRVEMESNLIMRVVYRAAMSQEVEIREVAFQCLVSIASKYYEVLEWPYVQLFELTLKAINGDVHAVSLQAIAFWSSICDVEMELLQANPYSDFIKYTIPHLIPILLESLEGVEEDKVDAVMNIIPKLLSHILKRLGQALDMQIDIDGCEKQQARLQASLCGLVQFLVEKLSGTDKTKHFVLQNADAIMTLFLRVLACSGGGEAMLATGALACATGPAFEKYVPELFKYLQAGLENFEECSITVGVVGDICRAIDDKILPFCNQIVSLLLKNLQSDDASLPTSVKPLIFSCIGDIALAIGVHFSEIMQGAGGEVCAQSDDQLRKSLLEAYSGILQGCGGDAKAEVMLPYAQYLLQFIDLNAQTAEGVVVQAATQGDLADALDK
ncbi:hypothetical protein Bca4012_084742 [Brassica carinata]